MYLCCKHKEELDSTELATLLDDLTRKVKLIKHDMTETQREQLAQISLYARVFKKLEIQPFSSQSKQTEVSERIRARFLEIDSNAVFNTVLHGVEVDAYLPKKLIALKMPNYPNTMTRNMFLQYSKKQLDGCGERVLPLYLAAQISEIDRHILVSQGLRLELFNKKLHF